MLRSLLPLFAGIASLACPGQSTYDAKILEYTGLRYACEGSGTPVLKIQNAGSATMGTCVVETWKNGLMVNTFNWILAVPALQGEVRQPALPSVPVDPGDQLEFHIISVNDEPDEDPLGNILAIDLSDTPALANGGEMEVRVELGDDPGAIVWSVTNQLNQVVATGGPYDESNSEVTDELDLPPGCYTFKAEDQTRSLAPDAVVRVKRGGNTLLVAADLEEPYSKGLRAGTLQACSYPIDLELRTDEAANETAYEIRSADGGTIHCTGGGISGGAQTLINGCCLPEGCYQLRVMDAGGDGIAGGGYILREGNGSLRRIIDNKDGFGDGGMSAIAGGEGFCLPLGNDRVTFTSCDKLDWRTAPCGAEYVVLNANADVTAQYGIDNAGSGYQIWFFDPNGGYSFKRFQSHATSNGMPVSATRACHFLVNGWSGNQLQEGVLYNVKARARVTGNYAAWGAACRFRIDNAAAQCPGTRLLDQPGNPNLSCGQNRSIGSNVLVHARPVRRRNASCNWVNANRYQFRFRVAGEPAEIVKTSATGKYWVNTVGLECGMTYQVDVRASFDNGASWCRDGEAWGDACLLTIDPCTGAELARSASELTESRLMLYPNPNDGGTVRLLLSSPSGRSPHVDIVVVDLAGRSVINHRFGRQEGMPLDVILELPDGMASGIYLVSAVTDKEVLSGRLVIRD